MTNAEIIQKVKDHQSNQYLHPLTCRVDSLHENLVAEERDNKVVLVCPTCKHVQEWIPEAIFIAPSKEDIDKMTLRK